MAAISSPSVALRLVSASRALLGPRLGSGTVSARPARAPFGFSSSLVVAPVPVNLAVSVRGVGLGSTRILAAQVGEKLPAGEFSFFDEDGNMQSISVEALTKGKKVVLLAVPGAFTPTCSQKHLPGFVEKAEELKAKGVDTIACVSVNDPFVMKAWGEQIGTGNKVLLLADGSAKFTADLGVTLDLTEKGLGIRSRRYALLAEDGVIKALNLEEGGQFTVSSAEEILKAL